MLAISAGLAHQDAQQTSALEAWVAELEGCDELALQVREKGLDDADLFSLCGRARALFSGPLLINGRFDIAIAAHLDGVHLPGSGLPAARLSSFASGPEATTGKRLLVGVSTHSLEEIEDARRSGADYVTFGPVFSTPSKKAFGEPQGLDALERACEIGLPILALGGIDAQRVPSVLAVGAHGIAGIRAFANRQEAERMQRAVASAPDG